MVGGGTTLTYRQIQTVSRNVTGIAYLVAVAGLFLGLKFAAHRWGAIGVFGTPLLLLAIYGAVVLTTIRIMVHRWAIGVTDLDQIQAMSGLEFEIYMKSVYEGLGYRVKRTPRSGDYGIDLILLKKDGAKLAVQCKRYSKPVGEPVIRDFLGSLIKAGISKGYVVTSSHFTEPAKRFVKHEPIALVDGSDLVKLIPQAFRGTAVKGTQKRFH